MDKVTGADRDAAAKLYEMFPSLSSGVDAGLKTAQFIRDGGADGWNTVRLFRDHRLAAQAEPREWRVPDGWKLVPVQPTEAMFSAVRPWPGHVRSIWSAMLAAAPETHVECPSGWRGIESAPKDGTSFLAGLWVRTNDAEPEWEQYVVWCDDGTGEIASGCDFGWEIADIEGWMPLPSPPAAEADNKENGRG